MIFLWKHFIPNIKNSSNTDTYKDKVKTKFYHWEIKWVLSQIYLYAAKSLQSWPTLCNPIDGSPPGSPVPGILQARTLEWVAISFANAWKWKVKVKSLSGVQLFTTSQSAAHEAPPPMGFFQARVLEWGAIAFSIYLYIDTQIDLSFVYLSLSPLTSLSKYMCACVCVSVGLRG